MGPSPQLIVGALLLLGAFLALYARVKPYNEFELIWQNNVATAIYFTHNLLEMVKLSAITGAA